MTELFKPGCTFPNCECTVAGCSAGGISISALTVVPRIEGNRFASVLSGEELDALLAGTEGLDMTLRIEGDPLGVCRMTATVANPDTIRKLVTEVKASRSHSRASGVKVQELEWREAALVHRFGLIVRVASTSVGEYRVLKGSQGRFDGFIDSGQVTASYETIEAAQAALQSHFNASIKSCLVAEGVEPVGWETPAEWDLEQRAFDAANHDDVPEWAQKVVQDLWQHYCLIANHAPPEAQAQGEGA